MDELVGLLTRERLLLERLLYRSIELRLMLGTEPRFVAWASSDVAAAAEALRDAELRRAVLYAALADEMRWPAEPFDWQALEAAAGEPHASILRELRADLAVLTTELQNQLVAIRQLGESGLAGVTEFLEKLGSPDDLVQAASRPQTEPQGPWAQYTPTSRINRTL